MVEGNKTVLAVRVIANGATTSASEEVISDAVFGTGGDLVNLSSQYSACSHGKLNFIKASDRSASNGDQISNGVVTVTVSSKPSGGDQNMVTAINSKLESVFGTAARNLADHGEYCL